MKNNNLIALHSQEGGGKDTVWLIINELLAGVKPEDIELIISDKATWNDRVRIKEYRTSFEYPYQNKKFATPLKQICAILTGTELEQWENREFKNTPLDGWGRKNCDTSCSHGFVCECITYINTPRQIMQDIAEAMCNINPDVFVDALFREYKLIEDNTLGIEADREERLSNGYYPSWIISDLRFLNELQAIQKRNGILVKIERDVPKSSHHSENSLNHFKDWDYVLDNSKDIPHLINEVEKMLKHFKVI